MRCVRCVSAVMALVLMSLVRVAYMRWLLAGLDLYIMVLRLMLRRSLYSMLVL